MTKRWSRHAYVQGFDCESSTFKKAVNMFKHMEISESIYEGVVEPSYKKLTRADANRAGHIRQKRGEPALPWNHQDNGESADKRRKWHVDSLREKLKI